MILISGPQVMQGYLNDPAQTNAVIKTINNNRYYITGDKGKIDQDGFVTIVDRYSRFAKIGGEMISLGSCEEQMSVCLGDEIEIAATNLTDVKKGEKIVLLFTGDMTQEALKQKSLSSTKLWYLTLCGIGSCKNMMSVMTKLINNINLIVSF
jgi:acyl-[acyl-carrier-protein]-phospholipid O-acyltransferase/long-chain-fatty-acid--[acyl-carrier-protein] ligase